MGNADNETRQPDSTKVAGATSTNGSDTEDSGTLRLFAEDVAVTRMTEETGRVRVARVTRTHDVPIEELLACETVRIETVPVGRTVDAMPAVRDDGDTMIIPIVEEILVVERRLNLKEELHVHRVRTTERHKETVTLRYQEAEVSRLPAQDSGPAKTRN